MTIIPLGTTQSVYILNDGTELTLTQDQFNELVSEDRNYKELECYARQLEAERDWFKDRNADLEKTIQYFPQIREYVSLLEDEMNSKENELGDDMQRYLMNLIEIME